MSLTSQALPSTRLFTADEYHRMSEIGIISSEERVELIEGEVIAMASKKPPHVVVSELCAEYLREILNGKAHIRTQDPVRLNDLSEPEPDIAIVVPPLRRYIDKHPSPGEIFWIIEVADTTLQFDLRRKSVVYASANIQEYWVVDAIAQEVHVFRGLADGAYTKQDVYTKNGIVRPLAFLEIEVLLKEFFP